MERKISSIEEWENIILTSNTDNLSSILDTDVIFYSPVVFTPQKGKVIVGQYLSAAVKVFQNKQFRYTNIIKSNNFTYAEFEAMFGNILVNGIDAIKIKNNLIIEFKVFIRPLKGIEIVWKEMRESLIRK
tara:strand:+ start:126 stop:515 length:390 start_codon:yes stop_codon:yes gene_type:complete